MTYQSHHINRFERRGSVVVIVLWTIAVAAIITSSVQLFGYRQAMLGREGLERIQARWAARAGLEDILMVMTDHTERPNPDNAMAMTWDMDAVSAGEMLGAKYEILHHMENHSLSFPWPMDEHAKMNINRKEHTQLLMMLEDMDLDVVDAVGDWLDKDNNANLMGAERDWYEAQGYLPRNGPLRSIGELELIAGMWPKDFRGDDWNLNNRLDPNENDGARSMPVDEHDDLLEGWSRRLTVYSVPGGATDSGEPRMFLRFASPAELEKRLGITAAQAKALMQYGRTSSNSLANLLHTPLPGSAAPASGKSGGNQNNPDETGNGNQGNQQSNTQTQGGAFAPLTRDQLRAVLAETCIEDPLERVPGKMNLNTISTEFLREFFHAVDLDEAFADEIISIRQSHPEGILSLVDLLDIPRITNEDLQKITPFFDTRSNVFTVSSRGRADASGLEVEMIAVVDRSTVPVRIIEYREQ